MLIKKYHSFIKEKNTRDIISGSFWIISGAILSRGLMLFALVMVARIITQEEYGEYGIIKSAIGMFTILAAFGMGDSCSKYIAERRGNNPTTIPAVISLSFFMSIVFGLLSFIMTLLLAKPIAVNYLKEPSLELPVKIAAVSLIFYSLNGVQNGVLYGLEEFKLHTKIKFITGLFSSIVIILSALIWGFIGVIFAMVVNSILHFIITYVFLNKVFKREKINPLTTNFFSEKKMLYRFSLPKVLSGLLVLPINWISETLVIRSGAGFANFALFYAANHWRTILLFIPMNIKNVLLPILSRTQTNSNKKSWKVLNRKNIALNLFIYLLLSIPIFIFSTFIMNFYGDSYIEGGLVLRLIVLYCLFAGVSQIFGNILLSKNKAWTGLLFNLVYGLLIISISYFLVIIKGLESTGLALGYLCTYVIIFIIQLTYLYKKDYL